MSTKVWLARLGSLNALAHEYYNESIIGVGWKIAEELLQEIMDFQQKNRSKAVKILKEKFNDPGGSLKRFLIDASEGDYITAGPVNLEDENNKLAKYFLIGKILSKPFIPTRGQYDDSEYPSGINIVRKVEWKAYEEEMPRGFKDYIGRNHHTFATAHRFDYKEIDILYTGGEINEFKKVENAYMSYTEEILNYLNMMDPFDFEDYVGELLCKNGWNIEVSKRSGDEGVDAFGTFPFVGNFEIEVIVQIKRYKGEVSKAQIEDFQREEIPQSYGLNVPLRVFITTGEFSKDAEDQALNENYPLVIMISGEGLVELATHSNLIPGIQWFNEYQENGELI